ncbi:MAG: heme-binding domain-containing protein [Acidobacteriota bacterium]|nr:heme-binding domain-containing protein [Acidobacteriota bacterium]
MRKALLWSFGILILIQLLPFGHSHTNPPATKEPNWDSPATKELFSRACNDCHSNQTYWRWYSYVAPVSWLIARDVNGGRRHLNVSQWDKPSRHADHIANEVKTGDMPPWFYLPLHPNAKLSDAEKQQFIAGAEKTFGPQSGPEDHDDHDDH